MYIYTPPEKWTETLFNKLSGEDNRFEFKRGDQWTNDINEFEKTLAKEICALANSFGGTLFLGVADKTKEIVGVPKRGKGNASAKAWIESIIPNLLEFRLPNFRVLDVDLTPETVSKIGEDKTVISIDVYDSDLAPHRSIKHKEYFYRQSSMSVPAPHHYLAYLWGRSSPNMSYVVNTWFKIYVNNLIHLLEKTTSDFRENRFDIIDEPITREPIYIRKIIFFDKSNWKALNSSLTAKQFLRTFPDIRLRIDEFDISINKFFDQLTELENIINNSPEPEKQIRKLYDDLMNSLGFREKNQFDDKPFEEILRLYAGEVYKSEQNVRGLINHPEEFKKLIVRMTTYILLNLDSSLMMNDSIVFNLTKEHIAHKFDESQKNIETILQQITKIGNEIAQKAELLSKEVDELRYALALKHNTTYE